MITIWHGMSKVTVGCPCLLLLFSSSPTWYLVITLILGYINNQWLKHPWKAGQTQFQTMSIMTLIRQPLMNIGKLHALISSNFCSAEASLCLLWSTNYNLHFSILWWFCISLFGLFENVWIRFCLICLDLFPDKLQHNYTWVDLTVLLNYQESEVAVVFEKLIFSMQIVCFAHSGWRTGLALPWENLKWQPQAVHFGCH